MKQLKHRQNVLAHRIEAIEGDMISITKETFEELDYLKRELEYLFHYSSDLIYKNLCMYTM